MKDNNELYIVCGLLIIASLSLLIMVNIQPVEDKLEIYFKSIQITIIDKTNYSHIDLKSFIVYDENGAIEELFGEFNHNYTTTKLVGYETKTRTIMGYNAAAGVTYSFEQEYKEPIYEYVTVYDPYHYHSRRAYNNSKTYTYSIIINNQTHTGLLDFSHFPYVTIKLPISQ